MKDIDETKQPLLEHLIELRRRLLWSLATLVVFFFICFAFAKDIFAVLVQPLLRAGEGRLIYTDIFEAFFVQVKVGFFAALAGATVSSLLVPILLAVIFVVIGLVYALLVAPTEQDRRAAEYFDSLTEVPAAAASEAVSRPGRRRAAGRG